MEGVNQQTCVVMGCQSQKRDKNISLHRFPKKQSVGAAWIKACGNVALQRIPYNELSKRQFFICHKHFDRKYYNARSSGGYRLHADTVPTINLPGNNDMDVKVDAKISLPHEENSYPSVNILLKPPSPLVGNLSECSIQSQKVCEDVRESSLRVKDNFENFEPREQDEMVPIEVDVKVEREDENLELTENKEVVEVQVDPDNINAPLVPGLTLTGKRTIGLRPSNRISWKLMPINEYTPRIARMTNIIKSTKKENSEVKKKIKRCGVVLKSCPNCHMNLI